MGLTRFVRRRVWLTSVYYVLDDWRAALRLARGRLDTRSGSRHQALDLAASLAYVDRIYEDYLRYAGVARLGDSIVEIGAGDNFGVALRMLADGAREVHAIDRYVPERAAGHQRRIYDALAERPGFRALFDGAPDEATIKNLAYHPGCPAERFFAGKADCFDAIVSRAVLEHLFDPLAALNDMARALKPGGLMVHRIDLRDHGMFAGHHPLTLLTIPGWLHRRMTRASGRPNRVLFPAYRDWLAHSGLEGSLRVSRLVGLESEIEPVAPDMMEPQAKARAIEQVRAIRPRLARRFRTLDDDMLAIAGLVLVARKPAHPTAPSMMSASRAATAAGS